MLGEAAQAVSEAEGLSEGKNMERRVVIRVGDQIGEGPSDTQQLWRQQVAGSYWGVGAGEGGLQAQVGVSLD
jgi:hypothetical protein